MEGVSAMPITENTPKRLVVKAGSTTLTLDKDAGKGVMTRKLLMFNLKPIEVALADITEIAVDAGVDRASGIEVCNAMIITKAGVGYAVPAKDKKDAEATAAGMRKFLGLKG
jgi:hypothetical protein